MKRISATDAKNNFGGLLDDVATHGRVEITRHGRVVAVVLSPANASETGPPVAEEPESSTANRLIRPDRARAARMRRTPRGFDE